MLGKGKGWSPSPVLVVLLVGLSPLLLPDQASKEANSISGYTYYWNGKYWESAPGALVTVELACKGREVCAEGTSDKFSHYKICLDSCRPPGSPPVELIAVAEFNGQRDVYQFRCYGQDEEHDFFCK